MLRILLIIFLLTSCSTYNTAQTDRNIPSWYLNPPQSNNYYLYGVGYGFDRVEATKVALNDISHRIKVTVSSNTSIIKQENAVNNNGVFENQVRQRIRSTVDEIEYKNFENEKTEAEGGYIYTLVKVPRGDLIETYRKKVIEADHNIMERFRYQKGKNIIKRKKSLLQAIDEIDKVTPNLYLLDLITNSSESHSYFSKYNEIRRENYIVTQKMSLKIMHYKNDLEIIDFFKNIFITDGIRIKQVTPVPVDINHNIIKISHIEDYDNLFGSHIVKMIFAFKVFDHAGNQIGRSEIETKGVSAQNKESARASALNNLRESIKTKSIFYLLGITQ